MPAVKNKKSVKKSTATKKVDYCCTTKKESCPEISVSQTIIQSSNIADPAKNLKRLSESSILISFVEKNSGKWDHAKWLCLCDEIRNAGFFPIDFDQVGLILEQLKAEYNS